MLNRMGRVISAYRDERRGRRAVEEWTAARERAAEAAEANWTEDDTERVISTLRMRREHDRAGVGAEPDLREEFDRVTAPLQSIEVDEALRQFRSGLQCAVVARSSAPSSFAKADLDADLGRELVALTRDGSDADLPFDGIGDRITRRFPAFASLLGTRLPVRYPVVVALTMAFAVGTAFAVMTGSLYDGLPWLVAMIVVDSLDGVFVRSTPRKTGGGMYTTCILSHLADMIVLAGVAGHEWRFGDQSVALAVAASGTVAMYGSFTRAIALQMGIRIKRSAFERGCRLGGLALACFFGTAWVAPVAITVSGVWEVCYSMWRVRRAGVTGVAVATAGPVATSEPRLWGCSWSPPTGNHSVAGA